MATWARWEWRTFGAAFGEAEGVLLEHASEARTSQEVYLLGDRTDIDVKIRDGVLHVKSLNARDASGLEQWMPILEAPFPVEASTVATLLTDIGVTNLPALAGTVTRARFLNLVESAAPAIRVVTVSKQRRCGEVDGCLVEVTDLVVDGWPMRTAAIESVNPGCVAQFVRRLNLDRLEILNYVTALRRVLPVTRGNGTAMPGQAVPA